MAYLCAASNSTLAAFAMLLLVRYLTKEGWGDAALYALCAVTFAIEGRCGAFEHQEPPLSPMEAAR
jgi:hypothetical protein